MAQPANYDDDIVTLAISSLIQVKYYNGALAFIC